MKADVRNPLKAQPSPTGPADNERLVALAAIGLAIKCAQDARQALLRRHRPSAEHSARQAVAALGALSRGRA